MAGLRLRPHKTQGKYAPWVNHTGPGGGMCFTITWGRLTEFLSQDESAAGNFAAMFANRLKENEVVERFEVDAKGITVFIENWQG